MKPVDKFSIQYSELLEYIYPVTQEYFPDFDYDEETGQAYILPSQTPDTVSYTHLDVYKRQR